jgi:predicted transcriptional regulator
MTRSEVQKAIRKSDIQGEVFSYLWGRRKNAGGSRLKDIASKLGRGSDRVSNGIKPLIKEGYVVQLSKGVYKVSDEVTV